VKRYRNIPDVRRRLVGIPDNVAIDKVPAGKLAVKRSMWVRTECQNCSATKYCRRSIVERKSAARACKLVLITTNVLKRGGWKVARSKIEEAGRERLVISPHRNVGLNQRTLLPRSRFWPFVKLYIHLQEV